MHGLLEWALQKRVEHERIIFVDVNLPADDQPAFQQDWHQEAMATVQVDLGRRRPTCAAIGPRAEATKPCFGPRLQAQGVNRQGT
jgi:hypothetical protein